MPEKPLIICLDFFVCYDIIQIDKGGFNQTCPT